MASSPSSSFFRSSHERGDEAKSPDLQRYRDEVTSLGAKLTVDADDQTVWEVYAATEKLIAVLKFRIDYETPGVFTDLPAPSGPSKVISDAKEMLSKAADELSRGRYVASIEALRRARNVLRSHLTQRRRGPRPKTGGEGRRSRRVGRRVP